MKNLIPVISILIMVFVTPFSLWAQTDIQVPCTGYPADEYCCHKNRGMLVTNEDGTFCYLNLFTSKVTKAECMEAGGYAYWRNDSTMLCLPRGIMVVTGNVSSIDEEARSLTITADNEEYVLLSGQLKMPQAGEVIDMYYTVEPDGSLHAKSCRKLDN